MLTLILLLDVLAASSAVFDEAKSRANFVFLFADDMRKDDMVALPRITKHIVRRGTYMENFFVNTPVCCPSRATLFSGNYPHNNVAPQSTAPKGLDNCCMHMNLLFGDVLSADSPPNGKCSNPQFWQRTWPVYLQKAGYNTGIFGKAYHMGGDAPCGHAQHNQTLWYGPEHPDAWTGARAGIPTVATNTTPLFMLPGWNRHFVYCYPLDQYFWNRFNDQGVLIGTRQDPSDYATALIGNKTVAWLREDAIPAAKADDRPFFAYVPIHPPHGTTTPAPWYNESWPEEWGIPRTNAAEKKPNYGYHAADHHWIIAHEPPINSQSAAATQSQFVQRLQMLLSVDDIIDEVTDLLTVTGVLENTYLMFCADHGWNLGEFGVMNGKHQVYEHTLRVPFIISGPGIQADRKLPDVISMAAIAPTILELAGVSIPPGLEHAMDGRSFAPTLLRHSTENVVAVAPRTTTMLVEFFSLSNGSPDTPPCGPHPHPPRMPNHPSCYNLNQSHSDWSNNTFIALRIINGTHNLTYAEYTQVSDMYHFSHVYFYELYDVATDPYQMKNIYYEQTEGTQAALHETLFAEFRCRGASCSSWSREH